jgi:ferrous iron transport protein B
MFFIFQSIFVLARPLMDFMEFAVDSLKGMVSDSLPPGPFTSLLLDGILAGVGGVVVFLPQILMLFAFLAVLEECGYMARAAFLMDSIMARCGLSGKSFIPLLSSLACAVPGIMATRVIENRRDRLVTILVAPLMSCSARLPVYYLLIEAFFHEPWWLAGVVMFILYMIGFITAPIVAMLIKGLVFKSEKSTFVLEMPSYRFPSISGVWNAMLDSGGSFLYQAGTLILCTMILVWALLYFPTVSADGKDFPLLISQAPDDEKQELVLAWKQQSWLGRTGQFIEPVFQPLGWDWRIGMSVLASFPAREVVIAALGVAFGEGEIGADDKEATARLAEKMKQAKSADGRFIFSHASAFGLLVFFSLCCQCSSTLVVIYKETKTLFWPAFTFVYMTTLAYCSALVIYQFGSLLGH